MIETTRLELHRWHERHRTAFAAMHADPVVMADLGGPIDASESSAKFERYRLAEREQGISRWAVEDRHGLFLGYAGVMPRLDPAHPLGPHHEVGWRFTRQSWGNGFATEAAGAALRHATEKAGIRGIVSYTGPGNERSRSVMTKLGLVRDPSRDFRYGLANGSIWHGLVWRVPTGP